MFKKSSHPLPLLLVTLFLIMSCSPSNLTDPQAQNPGFETSSRALTAGTITLYYWSKSPQAYVHFKADNQSWTTAPGVLMTPSAYTGYQTASLNASQLTFVFNDGSGKWDNPIGGGNYSIQAPGAYTVFEGVVYQGLPIIKLYYKTAWDPASIDFNADRKAWTFKNLDSIPGNPGYKVTEITASRLEFALSNNRQGHWDNNIQVDKGTVNYFINSPGIWKLEDGKITAGAPALKPVTQFIVEANQFWQNTGVYVDANDIVTVNYVSGTWTVNPAIGYSDADGNPNYTGKSGYALVGANEGALIGRIGKFVFLLGNSGTVPAGMMGTLEVATNDDIVSNYGLGYADNVGSITIAISK